MSAFTVTWAPDALRNLADLYRLNPAVRQEIGQVAAEVPGALNLPVAHWCFLACANRMLDFPGRMFLTLQNQGN